MSRFPLLFLAMLLAVPCLRAQQEEKPLPDIATLLDAVEKHEDRDEALLQQYTYHQHSIIEDFDSREGVKKTTINDYESIPINGVRINKLVSRNGQPLSAEEQKKIAEEFDKAVEKARKNKAKYQEKKAEAEREGKSNKQFLPASRVLQLGTFTNERRILFNGRPTIVLDFTGTKDAKTQNEPEKIIEDLAGTVWIDEEDKVIARAEGHFLNDFKIALGLLADIHKGLSFTMEEQKINGEVWLPRQFDGQGKASIGIFIRVHGHQHAEMSDFRKFRTTTTILGTNGVIDDSGQPTQPPPPANPPATEPKP